MIQQFPPMYIPKKNEKVHPHKNLYTNVHSSIMHHNQAVEMAQMSISWWLDKQKVVYPYNGMFLGHKKE